MYLESFVKVCMHAVVYKKVTTQLMIYRCLWETCDVKSTTITGIAYMHFYVMCKIMNGVVCMMVLSFFVSYVNTIWHDIQFNYIFIFHSHKFYFNSFLLSECDVHYILKRVIKIFGIHELSIFNNFRKRYA